MWASRKMFTSTVVWLFLVHVSCSLVNCGDADGSDDDVDFALSAYCRSMCKWNRGGNLCNCRAAYFAGKRLSPSSSSVGDDADGRRLHRRPRRGSSGRQQATTMTTGQNSTRRRGCGLPRNHVTVMSRRRKTMWSDQHIGPRRDKGLSAQ